MAAPLEAPLSLMPEEVPLPPVPLPLEEAPLVPEEVPLPPEEAPLVERITATLAEDVISFCEATIARLEEAASTLLQETGDGLENIVAAGDLIHNTFHYPVLDPEGAPLQAALRDLGSVIRVDDYAYPQRDFTAYANALGLIPSTPTWQLWFSSYALADSQARVALEWLKATQRESLAAGVAIRLCEDDWEGMDAAQQTLQQAIGRAKQALMALYTMSFTLAELDQIVINGAGQVLPP